MEFLRTSATAHRKITQESILGAIIYNFISTTFTEKLKTLLLKNSLAVIQQCLQVSRFFQVKMDLQILDDRSGFPNGEKKKGDV